MKNTTTQIAAANSVNHTPGVIVTLESAGIFLGVLVSLSVLATWSFKIASKINAISSSIDSIKEDLKTHSFNTEKIRDLDKRLDLNTQDYVNYKDHSVLHFNNLKERIDHVWNKTEKICDSQKAEIKELLSILQKQQDAQQVDIKEIQGFLQKQQNFTIRE
ncbi:hypothetical protein JYQ62_02045 [Nostoc sp. UHCC 0702]|nr:hypothetical protein JYQ62_02045 [Nostoc sp. UHCC 0702]